MHESLQADVIEAMGDNRTFGDAVVSVDHVETHISHVFLAGEHVYKIKKAVNFGFLNYSTLELRKHYCELEVELNNRLAPELYIGAVEIYRDKRSGRISLGQSENSELEIVEYAVKMYRFDESSILLNWMNSELDCEESNLFASVRQKVFSELGARVARFHLATPCSANTRELDGRYGDVECIRTAVEQNFNQIIPLITNKEDLSDLSSISDWSQKSLMKLKLLFQQRLENGFVKECHGDLHAGNIAIVDGAPLLFDCIEFNEMFRCIDVISEVAFLVMDLEANNASANAMDVLNAYISKTGDYEGLQLLQFYKVYRAMVRAKVSVLRLASESGADGSCDREGAFSECRQYIDLAMSYIAPKKPVLIISNGVSGVGKSTAAKYLCRHGEAIHLRADLERKRLFGLDELESSHEQGLDIYTDSVTKETFSRLREVAALLLCSGMNVVLDSTMLQEQSRKMFLCLASEAGADSYLVLYRLSDQLVRERLRKRQQSNDDVSEAGIAVMEQQTVNSEPLTEKELAKAYIVDMKDGKAMLDKVIAVLNKPQKRLSEEN